MKNLLLVIIAVLLFSPAGLDAQSCESTGYSAISTLPTWIQTLAPAQNKTPYQWGFFDANISYRQIVRLHLNDDFGISEIGAMHDNRDVMLLFVDPNAESYNGLIYGVYAQSDEEYLPFWSWDQALLVEEWLDVSCSEKDYSSDSYRKRAKIIVDSECEGAGGQLAEDTFNAWGGHAIDVRVIVVSFNNTNISDFSYKVPGIYGNSVFPSNGVLTCSDFQTEYSNIPESWAQTGSEQTQPTMVWDGNEIEITANQNLTNNGDVEVPDVALEVWGKMLSYNTGDAPEINTDYKYGLWVAGDIVSENFIMLPKESWADYVFQKDYELPKLEDIAAHIREHGHLPGIPAQSAIKEGYSQHEINSAFLEKIEQLTLYKVDHRERLQQLRTTLETDQKRMAALKLRLAQE